MSLPTTRTTTTINTWVLWITFLLVVIPGLFMTIIQQTQIWELQAAVESVNQQLDLENPTGFRQTVLSKLDRILDACAHCSTPPDTAIGIAPEEGD